MEELIVKVAKDLDINHKDSKGCTPLLLAGIAGNVAIGDLLIKHGANPALKNSCGFDYSRSLSLAVIDHTKAGNFKKLHPILEYKKLDLNVMNGKGFTAREFLYNESKKLIIEAAKEGDHEKLTNIKFGLGSERFKKIINKPIKDNETALTWASYYGHIDCIKIFIAIWSRSTA